MKYVESDEDVITVRKFIDKRATDLISEAESIEERMSKLKGYISFLNKKIPEENDPAKAKVLISKESESRFELNKLIKDIEKIRVKLEVYTEIWDKFYK